MLKLLLKAVLILAVLALLVMMGNNNPQDAKLLLPPILPKDGVHGPASYMFYGFFGVGFLVGAFIMSGGKKGSSKPSKEK